MISLDLTEDVPRTVRSWATQDEYPELAEAARLVLAGGPALPMVGVLRTTLEGMVGSIDASKLKESTDPFTRLMADIFERLSTALDTMLDDHADELAADVDAAMVGHYEPTDL